MICHIHTKFNYLNWLFFISHQLLCSRQASALSLVNKLSAKDPSLKVPDGLKAKPNPQSGIKHQWSYATMCFTSGPLLCGLMNALTETHLLLAFCLVLSSWVDQHYYFSTATKLVTIHSNTCYSIYIFFVIALLNIQIRIIISNDIDTEYLDLFGCLQVWFPSPRIAHGMFNQADNLWVLREQGGQVHRGAHLEIRRHQVEGGNQLGSRTILRTLFLSLSLHRHFNLWIFGSWNVTWTMHVWSDMYR